MVINNLALTIVNEHWTYVGEGAAHMVLQYCGTCENLKGNALRIPKKIKTMHATSKRDCDVRMEEMMNESSKFVSKSVLIVISTNPLTILSNHTIPNVNCIDLDSMVNCSTLTESAFYIPSCQSTMTFEIKPKWGSLPANPMHEAERVHCRYCMQQYQKMASGKFTTQSTYCPLNLFSDHPEKQFQAMNSLLKTAQNNFVFLLNGNKTPLSSLKEDHFHCEEAKLALNPHVPDTYSTTEKIVVSLLITTLNQSGILKNLNHVQNCSPLNDRMAFELYKNHLNHPNEASQHQLEDYLISRGARDCSIMIAIAQVDKLPAALPPTCLLIQLISF